MIPDTKKAAVLDLGTNTFHLLIAEGNGTTWKTLFKKEIGVKLGEGGINHGRISEAAFDRGLRALKEFKADISDLQPGLIRCVGTAALRQAENGPEFIATVHEETGIQIEVISGDEEAALIFKGVLSVLPDSKDTALIIDIGGGSVEFILFKDRNILWKQSFAAGAAKLMGLFHFSDPISASEILFIEHFLGELFQPLLNQIEKHRSLTLIGSAGSFETLLQLENDRDLPWEAPIEPVCKKLDIEKTKLTLDWILKSTHNERIKTKAIIPVRKDMIVTAAVLTRFVMGKINAKQLLVSTASLKEGVLYSLPVRES